MNQPSTFGAGTRSLPPMSFALLVLLAALSVLPINIISPALPEIAAQFRSEPSVISLSVAGYALVTALVGLVSGALSDRYGRRPVALISTGLFVVASIGCSLSQNITLFLAFRSMQASVAACFSVALAALKETSTEGRGASRIGYAAMAWAIAPMIGPTIGGALDQTVGWRSIFVFLALMGGVMFVWAFVKMRETTPPLDRSDFTYFKSYALLLGSVRFWLYAACMAFSTGTNYLFLANAPLAIGGSSAILGLYMGLVPVGFIIGSFLTGRYSPRFSRGILLIFGRSLTCLGLIVGVLLLASGNTNPLTFFLSCMFVGIGNGLSTPAANMGAMSIRNELSGTAAGLVSALSIGGGAVVVSLGGLALSGHVTPLNCLIAILSAATLSLSAAIFAEVSERNHMKIKA